MYLHIQSNYELVLWLILTIKPYYLNDSSINNSKNPTSIPPFSFEQTNKLLSDYPLFIHSRNIRLTLVKVHDLFCSRRFFRLFVLSNSHKSRESQRYSLICIHQSDGSRMNRRNGQIGSADFPDLHRIQPNIRFD